MPDDFEYELREDASAYTSQSQVARKWTESWVLSQMYCPACGCPNLTDFEANMPVADFFCDVCDEQYELKAKNGAIRKTVPDGAYKTMIERLNSETRPSLMIMRYEKSTRTVRDIAVIPKPFFIPELIKKRKPLSKSAQRAGWVGCDIRIDRVPDIGVINLIQNRQAVPKEEVLVRWEKLTTFRQRSVSDMGWVADVLRCIERIGTPEFTLSEVYAFENYLSELHPENNHVKPKIRQQLQVLRDAGLVEFVARGRYRLVE